MTDKKQFNTNRPPEIVANELIRDIENYLFDSDVKVIFGDAGHDLVLEFVNQCNSDVEKYYDEAAKSYIENQRLQKENDYLRGLCVQAYRELHPFTSEELKVKLKKVAAAVLTGND